MHSTKDLVRIAATVLTIAWSTPVDAMTIEQAYATIPHRRTAFDPTIASMAPNEASYLKELFNLIDLAVKERVETLSWLQSQGAKGEGTDEYDSILLRLHHLQVPGRLQTVHQLVTEAIQEHRDILREWRKAPETISMTHPLVRSSSQKLYQAYGMVMQLYAKEQPRNQQAFYDYFCCLDFL